MACATWNSCGGNAPLQYYRVRRVLRAAPVGSKHAQIVFEQRVGRRVAAIRHIRKLRRRSQNMGMAIARQRRHTQRRLLDDCAWWLAPFHRRPLHPVSPSRRVPSPRTCPVRNMTAVASFCAVLFKKALSSGLHPTIAVSRRSADGASPPAQSRARPGRRTGSLSPCAGRGAPRCVAGRPASLREPQ